MFTQSKKTPTKQEIIAKFDQKYKEYFSAEKVDYFRLLMIAICTTCFVALLVFAIQAQESSIVAFMASISAVNFILIFVSHKFKLHLQHILALLYVFYVAAVSIIVVNGTDVPFFIHGYSSGMLFSTIIQFCDTRLKVIFVIFTPWIFFAFADNLSLNYIHYITYTLSTSSLLGLTSYQFDIRQRQLFSQSIIIEKQLEIIKEFTSDNLFAISYDERQGQFKLEFANKLFENTHTEDIKEFLRKFSVVLDLDGSNQKKNTKMETLEEYFFEYHKREQDCVADSYFNLKIRNKNDDQIIEIMVKRSCFIQPIFIIAIKSNKADIHQQRYENKIKRLKDSIINLSAQTGKQLQILYQSISKLNVSDNKKKSQEICKKEQTNIFRMLNRMKNYLMYFQREKLQMLNQSIECYQLRVFQKALLSYFEIKCAQNRRIFINTASTNFNDSLILRLNQQLLTQILVNVFHIILDNSILGSIIRLTITQEDNSHPKQYKSSLKTFQSNKEQLNSQELSYYQILQFKFTFTTETEIENLDKLLYVCSNNEDEQKIDLDHIIVSSVNYIILRMIGPYNEIFFKSSLSQDLEKYLNEVSFFVYTDQTRLDPSFIKFIQLEQWE